LRWEKKECHNYRKDISPFFRRKKVGERFSSKKGNEPFLWKGKEGKNGAEARSIRLSSNEGREKMKKGKTPGFFAEKLDPLEGTAGGYSRANGINFPESSREAGRSLRSESHTRGLKDIRYEKKVRII